MKDWGVDIVDTLLEFLGGEGRPLVEIDDDTACMDGAGVVGLGGALSVDGWMAYLLLNT